MAYILPAQYIHVMHEMHGAAGEQWITRLPEVLADLEQHWSIRLLPPFNLSYNYVTPAVRADGTEVVFKIGYPDPELLSEMAALKAYDGRGIIRLFESDPKRGAMLLERLTPGVELATLEDDDEATRITAHVMQQLWIPAPEDPKQVLCRSEKWAAGLGRLRRLFDGGTGPFPTHLVEQAEGLFVDLFASAAPPALLHGDLHHWNILSAQRQPWLALDPKGLLGEPAYEVGALLRNRWPENATPTDLQHQVARRIAIFSEILGFDRQRMLAWSMAQAVLSAWWSYEDHHRVENEMLAFAQAQADLL